MCVFSAGWVPLCLASPFLPIFKSAPEHPIVLHVSVFNLWEGYRAANDPAYFERMLDDLDELPMSSEDRKKFTELRGAKTLPLRPIPWSLYAIAIVGALAAGLALAGRAAWLPVPSVLWLAGVVWLLTRVHTGSEAVLLSPFGWAAAFGGGLLLIVAWYAGRRIRVRPS